MQDQYDVDRPEPWYIRRGAHKGEGLSRLNALCFETKLNPLCVTAAFAVASLEEAELRLKHYNIEYHKFMVPGERGQTSIRDACKLSHALSPTRAAVTHQAPARHRSFSTTLKGALGTADPCMML